MISLLIILALVTVPLALIARLSFTVIARLLGVVSQSEVATRAEFARIREQLLATAGDGVQPVGDRQRQPAVAPVEAAEEPKRSGGVAVEQPVAVEPHSAGSVAAQLSSEPAVAVWHSCPTCAASVPSTARICLQCGAALSAR